MGGEGREVGVCGIACSECPARAATIADDDALRARTAEEWSRAFGANLVPGDINCTGCVTPGVKFAHCLECGVRLCGTGRGMANCAGCADYEFCETLREIHAMVPQAKQVLDSLRAGI
jgi:hypothetical protein